jgi:hypothetical protein
MKCEESTGSVVMNNDEVLEEFVYRARRETYMKNVEYFHIARALYASRTYSNETLTLTDENIVEPQFLPFVAQEYNEMYETYVGDYDGREPRFDYEYLFHIELPVLKFFLPYLRRADIFNEHGAPTTFAVSKNSIRAMIHHRWDKEVLDCVDLASFFVTQIDTVMGPCFSYSMGLRVSASPDEVLEVMDDPMGKISLSDIQYGILAPKYDDVSKRYYDCFGQQDSSSLN